MKLSTSTVRPMNLVGRNHEALHQSAGQVTDFDEGLDLAERLARTLVRKDGMALAAAQVGRPLNVVVTSGRLGGRRLANVHVTDLAGGTETGPEGCLTLPGRWYSVERHLIAHVAAYDLVAGAPVGFTARGVEARMWQHEADHLAGRLLAGRFPELRGR